MSQDRRLKPSDSYELSNYAFLRLATTTSSSSVASSTSDLNNDGPQSPLITPDNSETDEARSYQPSPRVMRASLARKLLMFNTDDNEMAKVCEIRTLIPINV